MAVGHAALAFCKVLMFLYLFLILQGLKFQKNCFVAPSTRFYVGTSFSVTAVANKTSSRPAIKESLSNLSYSTAKLIKFYKLSEVALCLLYLAGDCE